MGFRIRKWPSALDCAATRLARILVNDALIFAARPRNYMSEQCLAKAVGWATAGRKRGVAMRSTKILKPTSQRGENDFADWYVIGGFAVASLSLWLLLLSKGPF